MAPLKKRVERLTEQEKLSEEAARKLMRASDTDRDAFLRDLASRVAQARAIEDAESQYDLAINTGSFGIDAATSMIMSAAGQLFGTRGG